MVSPSGHKYLRARDPRPSLLDFHAPLLCLRPAPTLRLSRAPLLAIFGELDSPEGVKANVRAIKQIMDQAGRRDYTVKVYPNGGHNLMEVPPDNPKEYVRLKRFPLGFFEAMVDWTTTQVRRRPVRR